MFLQLAPILPYIRTKDVLLEKISLSGLKGKPRLLTQDINSRPVTKEQLYPQILTATNTRCKPQITETLEIVVVDRAVRDLQADNPQMQLTSTVT